MICYKFNLNYFPKIRYVDKETLIPPRVHYTRRLTEHVMYVIVNGSMKIENNGKVLELKVGDVRLFRKGDMQKAVESSYCEYYYIHFESEGLSELELSEKEYNTLIAEKKKASLKINVRSMEAYDSFDVCVKPFYHIHDKGVFMYITDILKNNCVTPSTKSTKQRLAIAYAFISILFKLENMESEEKEGKTYRTVKSITDYIDNHYRENISGKTIEEKFYINFDYANRIFKKIMGQSILKYRNTVRINEAKTKILNSDMSIGEIANTVGFDDTYYFSRIFKKHEGISPTKYKKNAVQIMETLS